MPRVRFDPTLEQQLHIIHGGDPKHTIIKDAETIMRAGVDAMFEHDDPMRFGAGPGLYGAGELSGEANADIQARNKAQSAGLDSGAGDGVQINMDSVNFDPPTQSDQGLGPITYGNGEAERATDGRGEPQASS